MKKLMIIGLTLFTMFALNACDSGGLPNEVDAAVCTAGNIFRYVYKDDVVYEFYLDGVLQDESMKDIVQSSVDDVGTVREYLDETFEEEGACSFSSYMTNGKE
ncbi:MAG: hypothetical protein KAH13_05815 [Tenericutes bacterium]|nr:hypothetical protein [Mycoplasmatota bacterium]